MGIETNCVRCPSAANRMAMMVFLMTIAGVAGCSKQDTERGNEASLDDLNRAYVTWGMTRGSYAKDLNELTNFPALQGKRLPQLPPGKKLVVDPNSHQIVIADR